MSEQPQGLDALDGIYRELPIDEIRVVDALRAVNADAVESIMNSLELNGGILMQPIVVDKNQVLIDGGHRLEALRQLGWERVPVKILPEVGSAEQRDMLGLIANNVRRQMTPMEVVRAYPTVAPIIKADAERRMKAGKQPSANFAEGRGPAMPAAPDGLSRTTIRNVLGMAEDRILQVMEIQEVASDEGRPAPVRERAQTALRLIEGRPGAITSEYKRVMSAADLASRPPAERAMVAAVRVTDQVLKPATALMTAIGRVDITVFADALTEADLQQLQGLDDAVVRFLDAIEAQRRQDGGAQ